MVHGMLNLLWGESKHLDTRQINPRYTHSINNGMTLISKKANTRYIFAVYTILLQLKGTKPILLIWINFNATMDK